MTSGKLVSFVDDTTVHGVKEMYYSNGWGKAMWVVVFACCFVGLSFQVSGLFRSYIKREKGSRVNPRIQQDLVSIPSLYVCSKFWRKPNINERTTVSDVLQNVMFQDVVGSVLNPPPRLSLEDSDNVSIALEDLHLLNRVSMAENGSLDGISVRKHLQAIFWEILKQSEGSLVDLVKNQNVSEGLIDGVVFTEHIQQVSLEEAYTKLGSSIVDVQTSTKYLVVNLNGVCIELRPPLEAAAPEVLEQTKYSFNLHHAAGYALPNNYQNVAKEVFNATNGIIDITKQYPTFTMLAMATRGGKQLYFKNMEKIDADITEVVTIRYWGRKTDFRSTIMDICSDWSLVDHAHCTRQLLVDQAKKTGEPKCLPYLVPSRQYKETDITNETSCSYQGELAGRSYNETIPSLTDHTSSILLENYINILTKPSANCPKTCGTEDFDMEIFITTAKTENTACIDLNKAIYETNSTTSPFDVKGDVKEEYLGLAVGEIPKMPCTSLVIMPAESLGLVISEYELYSFSDCTANVGAAVGLWIGASVISLMQALYIFILARWRNDGDETDATTGEFSKLHEDVDQVKRRILIPKVT